MSQRVRILKDISIFSISSYIVQFIAVMKGFIAAKLLGPSVMGSWSALMLIYTYGICVHFGILDGMNRTVPYLRGKGDLAGAELKKDTAFTFTIVNALAFLLILLVISFNKNGSLSDKLGLMCMGLSIPLYQVYNYYILLNRFRSRFKVVSVVQVILPIVELSLIIGFVASLKIQALYVGFIGSYIVGIIVLFIKTDERYKFKFDRKSWIEMAKTGLPIFISSFVFIAISTADKLIIARYLPSSDMGYYSFAVQLNAIIFSLSTSVTSIVYIKMLERYGEKGSISSLWTHLHVPTMLLATFNVICIGGVLFCLNIIIPIFLPLYIPSIPLFKILSIGWYFMALTTVAGVFLVTINEQVKALLIQCIIVPFIFIFGYAAVKLKMGITGISITTSVCYFLYASILIMFAYLKQARHINSAMVSLFKNVYLASIVGFIAIILLDTLSFGKGTSVFQNTFVNVLRFVVLCMVLSPFIINIEQKVNLFSMIASGLSKYFIPVKTAG